MDVSELWMGLRCEGEDPRRARILEGALRVFLTYGFDRATMDDIARAADLSRPALYLVFRNKKDIYRAISRCVAAQIVTRAQDALASRGTLLERLDLLIQNALFEMVREIEESPHGSDLLDIRNKLAGDIFDEWRGRMIASLEAAFAEEIARTGADLADREISTRVLAETLLDALEGMKARLSDPLAHLAAARAAVRVLVAALRP